MYMIKDTRLWLYKQKLRCIFASIFLLMLVHYLSTSRENHLLPSSADDAQCSTHPAAAKLVKPPNTTVSALVFAGRRNRLQCLHCYLKRDLVNNGGWLDEVIWLANTNIQDDLEYLDKIINSSDQYKRMEIENLYDFGSVWEKLKRGRFYVKIDDDIAWLADDAIARLVAYKQNHPGDFYVSANVINNPPLGFIHHHIGAVHPYFPEIQATGNESTSWKPSSHPYWQGPPDFSWSLDAPAPSANGRWLRVRDDKMLPQTPAGQLKYEVWGESYSSWAIAAQIHYSFLENIERDQLELYKFHPPWNMHGDRMRINLMAVWADDILDTMPSTWPEDLTDEDMIAVELPAKLHRPVNILGEALAVHFSYMDQAQLLQTDLIQRYRALALEKACVPGLDF